MLTLNQPAATALSAQNMPEPATPDGPPRLGTRKISQKGPIGPRNRIGTARQCVRRSRTLAGKTSPDFVKTRMDRHPLQRMRNGGGSRAALLGAICSSPSGRTPYPTNRGNLISAWARQSNVFCQRHLTAEACQTRPNKRCARRTDKEHRFFHLAPASGRQRLAQLL